MKAQVENNYCCKVKLFRNLSETEQVKPPQDQKQSSDSRHYFIVLGLLELEGKKMSPLLKSIFDITKIFNQCASHDCDRAALAKKNLKNLLEREFGDVLQVRIRKGNHSIDLGL